MMHVERFLLRKDMWGQQCALHCINISILNQCGGKFSTNLVGDILYALTSDRLERGCACFLHIRSVCMLPAYSLRADPIGIAAHPTLHQAPVDQKRTRNMHMQRWNVS